MHVAAAHEGGEQRPVGDRLALEDRLPRPGVALADHVLAVGLLGGGDLGDGVGDRLVGGGDLGDGVGDRLAVGGDQRGEALLLVARRLDLAGELLLGGVDGRLATHRLLELEVERVGRRRRGRGGPGSRPRGHPAGRHRGNPGGHEHERQGDRGAAPPQPRTPASARFSPRHPVVHQHPPSLPEGRFSP
ncbi:MAG: hypothetical protein E6I76_11240 [Chloroflexi bacterium]|nr:MAG: hypothetical protein E6I76_11240 [Chloroflexota bacterium]